MSKYSKLLGILLTTLSLAACEQNNTSANPFVSVSTPDISKEGGSAITEEEAYAKSQYISENLIENLPSKLSIKTTKDYECTVKINDSGSGKGSYRVKHQTEKDERIQECEPSKYFSHEVLASAQVTEYFEDEASTRVSYVEHWRFYKDGYIYQVTYSDTYYVGQEHRLESYYYKSEATEELAKERFTLRPVSIYGYSDNLANNVQHQVVEGRRDASNFYSFSNESVQAKCNPTYRYYSNGGQAEATFTAEEKAQFENSDISDWGPSWEAKMVSKLDYQQNYAIQVKDFYKMYEQRETHCDSMRANGDIVRSQSNYDTRMVFEGCNINYPDLSKFQEEPMITK